MYFINSLFGLVYMWVFWDMLLFHWIAGRKHLLWNFKDKLFINNKKMENLPSLWGLDLWKLPRGRAFDQNICLGGWDLTFSPKSVPHMVVWHVEFLFTCFSPFQPFQHEKGVRCISTTLFCGEYCLFCEAEGCSAVYKVHSAVWRLRDGSQDAGGGMLSLLSELQSAQ